MKFTIEMVDELRKRANVGYKEAKEALEKFDGDLVEALAYLDEQNKTKNSNCCHGKGFMETMKKIIKKGNETFLKITKNDVAFLNLPMTIIVPVALIATPLFLTVLVIAILTGCKIRFVKSNGEDHSINQHFDKVSDIVNHATEKFTQEMKNE